MSPRSRGWLTWVLGVALLGTVVAGTLRVSEAQDFVLLARQVEPWWFGLAIVLQAGTYVAQGGIWRRVGGAAGHPIPTGAAFGLSLAKLFADQALPSAGISGSVVVARALEQRAMPGGAVKAAVLINLATYHIGYIVTLAAALAILEWEGHATLLIVLASLLFLLFAIALVSGVVVLPGRQSAGLVYTLQRIGLLRAAVLFVQQADPDLVRSPRLLVDATCLQVAIVLLDAATVWALVRSLGVSASAGGVFASFMMASLVRTIGIVPGGLGTFEATSVLTLTMTGTAIPAALSATLLFRGLSFWAPMLPGLWYSRRAVAPRGTSSGS